jgi:hypothetical protein
MSSWSSGGRSQGSFVCGPSRVPQRSSARNDLEPDHGVIGEAVKKSGEVPSHDGGIERGDVLLGEVTDRTMPRTSSAPPNMITKCQCHMIQSMLGLPS